MPTQNTSSLDQTLASLANVATELQQAQQAALQTSSVTGAVVTKSQDKTVHGVKTFSGAVAITDTAPLQTLPLPRPMCRATTGRRQARQKPMRSLPKAQCRPLALPRPVTPLSTPQVPCWLPKPLLRSLPAPAAVRL